MSDVLRALDMGPHPQSHGIDYLTFLAAALDWATCVSKPKLDAYVADAFNMCVHCPSLPQQPVLAAFACGDSLPMMMLTGTAAM